MDPVRRFDSHRVVRSLTKKRIRDGERHTSRAFSPTHPREKRFGLIFGLSVRTGLVSRETGDWQLRKDGLGDLAGDVGEAEVAALEAIDQSPMVDAEEGEDRGV